MKGAQTMKINLHQYATEWAAAVGHELDGITTDEVMAEVNANLTQYDEAAGVEIVREPIAQDEAEIIRGIIERLLRANSWRVIGYGLDEHGIEYGIYTDTDGHERIEVRTDSETQTCSTIDEAERICADMIATWERGL